MLKTDKKFIRPQKWNDFSIGEENGYLNNYAYNPIIARNTAGQPLFKFTELIQESSNQDSNVVYAVPPHYQKDFNTRLWEFDIKFPAFSIPSNKVVYMDITNDVRDNNSMLTRGVTLAKNSTNQIGFIADGFLEGTGCPSREFAANNPSLGATQFTNWINSITQSTLNQAAVDAVQPFSSYEAVMFNWECVEQNQSPEKENIKLLNMLSNLKVVYPTIKFSCWNVGAAAFNRDSYQSGVSNVVSQKYAATLNVLDFGYCGGYMNFPTDYGVIHHYLKEFNACKALAPNKKTLWTFWFDLEFLSDTFLIRRNSPRGRNVNENGNLAGDYVWFNKPAVFNQVMYNVGIWSVAVGDGFHLWSDPVLWTDNVSAYPFGATKNGNPLSNPLPGKMYARNDMKNIDWMMRGVYGISKHKNIIEAQGTWVFNNTIDNSMLFKQPLIAHKTVNGESLILVYCWYNSENTVENVNVNINGVNHSVQVVGTWTTIKKV